MHVGCICCAVSGMNALGSEMGRDVKIHFPRVSVVLFLSYLVITGVVELNNAFNYDSTLGIYLITS